MTWSSSNDTAGNVRVDLTTTNAAIPLIREDLGDGFWDFSFAVGGLTEEQAKELGDEIMTLLCGGGRFRHSWLGRKLLLGCKRLVVGSEKPRAINDPGSER